jgi:hypothetical protein
VNVGKLKRVAIKEFTRSPAKTGILLAALPIALYFCVPLLFGALKKSSPSNGGSGLAKVSNSAAFVLPASTKQVATPRRVEQGWVEVAHSLANDLLAVPASIPSDARNPFFTRGHDLADELLASVYEDERIVLPGTKDELAKPVDQTPVARNPIRELGLELNATMVGQRSRLATINGTTYGQGETIPVIVDQGMAAGVVTTVPLEVAHVHRRFVVLKMDGYQHRLQLPDEVTKDAIVVKSHPE